MRYKKTLCRASLVVSSVVTRVSSHFVGLKTPSRLGNSLVGTFPTTTVVTTYPGRTTGVTSRARDADDPLERWHSLEQRNVWYMSIAVALMSAWHHDIAQCLATGSPQNLSVASCQARPTKPYLSCGHSETSALIREHLSAVALGVCLWVLRHAYTKCYPKCESFSERADEKTRGDPKGLTCVNTVESIKRVVLGAPSSALRCTSEIMHTVQISMCPWERQRTLYGLFDFSEWKKRY